MTTIATEIIPSDVISAGSDAIRMYSRMIRNGESPRLAEMLALRSAPRVNTDTSMVAQQNQARRGSTLADQFRFNENILEEKIRVAKKHGYSPRATDYYDATRARFPGDPRAFTGSSQTIGDIARDMERTGDGMASGDRVVVKPRTDVAPTPPKKLSEKITDTVYKKMVKDDPSLLLKDRREVRSMIKEKHGSRLPEAVE